MPLFLYDTWALVALAHGEDPHHGLAGTMDRRLTAAGFVGLVTDYVLDETLTMLQASAGARASLGFLDTLQPLLDAQVIRWATVGGDGRAEALIRFRAMAPQVPRISFTDCTSFAVMESLRIRWAFTADEHFLQAGPGIRPLFERVTGRLVAVGP